MNPKSVMILLTVVSERLGAHVLELPYKGNTVSMFIILPPNAKSNGIESVIKQLSVESLQEIVEDDLPRAVEVSIPKFTVEETIELTPVSLCDQHDTSNTKLILAFPAAFHGLRMQHVISVHNIRITWIWRPATKSHIIYCCP